MSNRERNGAKSITQSACQEEEPPSCCKYKPDNRLTPIQQSTRCLSTPQTIYLNGSASLTQLHVTKKNYSRILVLWEIPNVLRRSLRECTIILHILINGQKRYCRKPNLHSHRCQELKLQRWLQRMTSKTTGNEWIKGLCHLSVASLSLIMKQQHSITCSWQCTRRISQHASLWSGGELDWQYFLKRSSEITLFINYEQSAYSKLISIG